MPSAEDWVHEFRLTRPLYERFCKKLQSLLEDLLSSAGVPYQVVEARAKTVESFAEKINREGKGYVRPLQELTDLVGLRIILYYVDDVPRACDLIHQQFEVDDAKSVDKGRSLAPDQFGYLSVHKIVKLAKARAGLPEWSAMAKMVAEIQVRTVVQHSWAAISHALQYKHEADVPLQFRRRLGRLAGLLELADQEFAALRHEQILLKAAVSVEVSSGNLDIAVDADTIGEFVSKSDTVKRLMASALSVGFETVSEQAVGSGIPQLTQACLVCGVGSIVELDAVLGSAMPLAEKFLRSFLGTWPYGLSVSDAHVAAMLLVARRGGQRDPEKISDSVGWSRDYASGILLVAKSIWP
jgi:putative GTP pyrophosphokinase